MAQPPRQRKVRGANAPVNYDENQDDDVFETSRSFSVHGFHGDEVTREEESWAEQSRGQGSSVTNGEAGAVRGAGGDDRGDEG